MAEDSKNQDNSAKVTRRRSARVFGRIAMVIGAVLIALLLVIAGAVLYLRTDSGLTRAARLIEGLVSSDQMTLSIGALTGAFPEHLRIDNFLLTDATGTLISGDYAELRWRPSDLLARRLTVEALEVGILAFNRLPAGEPPAPEAEPARSSGLPTLPVDVAIDRIHIGELSLGEAVAGQPVRLTATATLDASRRGEFGADASVRRLDGVAAQLVLAAKYDRTADYLKVDVDAHEPEGGLVATLAGLPGAPPVRLRIAGEGPLNAWKGDMSASAGSLAAADATVGISGQEPRQVVFAGKAAVEGLLPPNLAPLVAGGIAFRGTADVGAERITVGDASVSTSAGALHGEGTFVPANERLDARATLTLGPSNVLKAVAPGVAYETAGATAVVSGRLPVPDLQLDARALKLTLDTLAVGEASLQAKVTATDDTPSPPLDLKTDIVARDVETSSNELAGLVKEPLRASLDGTYAQASKRLIVRQLRANAGPVNAEGTADVQLADPPVGTANLKMDNVDLAPFGPLIGTPVGGKARLHATFAADQGGPLHADIEGGVADFTSKAAELATLIGANPQLTARVSGNPASNIDIAVNIKAAQFTASADGQLAADMTVVERANLNISAEDLRGLRPLVGAPIGGAFNVTAQVQGPLEKLTGSLQAAGKNIVYQNERVDRLQLTVDGRDLPANGEGTVALDAATSRGPIAARGAFKREGQDQVRVDRFDLTYAEALTATTRLLVPLNGRPIDGTVAVRSEDLTPVGRAIGASLAGRLNLDVALQALGTEQRVGAVLRADSLRYGSPAAAVIGVGKLAADVELGDAKVKRRLRANLVADAVAVADGQLTRTTVRATGSDGAYQVHGETAGNLQGVTQVATDADIRLAANTVITLRQLRAEIRDEWLRLVRPARVTIAGDRMAVDDLAVTYGSAQATLSAQKSTQRVDGRLALRDLDLRLIDRFKPGTGLRGVVRADASLSGASAAPAITFGAQATDLGMGASSRQLAPSRATSLTATLQGRVGGGRGELDLVGQGLGDVPLRVNLSAPIRFAAEPFAFQILETGPISGRASWQGNVDRLWSLLPIDAFMLSGFANMDLAIAGTVRQPAVTGDITLARGSFEVYETGTVLRPLDVVIAATPGEVRLTRLEAGDGGDGTLRGSGVVTLGAPMHVDTRIEFKEFGAVRRDDVVSRLNGAVAIDGAIGDRMQVAGRIENAETEIRLVNRLPPQVTAIPVEFVDKAQALPPAPAAPSSETAGAPVDLDLTIDLPGRVYVRGRGLESEWAGSFFVSGTAAKPQVRGSLQPLRGKLDFLGKTFELTKGKIAVEGLDRDIMIDMTAAYSRSDFKALILISGTAKQPKITLRSDPELPQDEILARVLFNKPTGKLGPAEGAQLAAAAAALASGEPGVIDKLRDATGLDQLRFGGAEEGGGIGTVEAGKHVGDNVYVGVEQGASAASTAAVIEVDITESIKLRSTTTSAGSNRVGVRWEWDY